MAILPATDIKKLEFVEAHIAAWTSSAALIGLLGPQVVAIDNAAKAARQAFNAQQIAKNAAKGATQTFHNATEAMVDLVRVAITNIKNKADSAHDPNVYTLAQIPPPADPAPVGPPDAPTNVVADPNADGTVSIRWKGTTANQTFFTLWRRTTPAPGSSTEWSSLGATAAKNFIDATVPSGVAGVEYRVTAQRQTFISQPSTTVAVNFGGGAGGSLDVAGFIGAESNASNEAA